MRSIDGFKIEFMADKNPDEVFEVADLICSPDMCLRRLMFGVLWYAASEAERAGFEADKLQFDETDVAKLAKNESDVIDSNSKIMTTTKRQNNVQVAQEGSDSGGVSKELVILARVGSTCARHPTKPGTCLGIVYKAWNHTEDAMKAARK